MSSHCVKWVLLVAQLFLSAVVQATEGEDSHFLREGLEVLYLKEVDRYRSCHSAGKPSCRYSELNVFLGLLDLAGPVEKTVAKYPPVAERSLWQGVVDAVLVISDDGTVSETQTLFCESGRSRDVELRWRWELEGSFCREFRYAAEKAFSSYKFLESPESLRGAERLANVRGVFQLTDRTGRTDHDVNQQVMGLTKSQVRKLETFINKKDWKALTDYALERREENEVFEYYLGDAAWESGDKAAAIAHFTAFLEKGGDQYWHFGTKAMVIAIDHFYEVADDQRVVDLGDAFLLERYLHKGNSISKALVAEALTKYAISLTLIEDQELAQALYLFRAMERVGLYRGIPSELQEVIQTQRSHLESQIIAIGKARATQH